MEFRPHKDYRAEMRCVEDEYIGLTEVNLYDEKGRHMFTSCQLDDQDGLFERVMHDMSLWCIDNIEPNLKYDDHNILWYKIG